MSDREPDEYPTDYSETQLVLIPILIEAVLVTMFIACSILLVAVLAAPSVPI